MKTYSGNLMIIALLAAMPISQAHARVTRCNNGLVSVGDLKASVVQKCGEPQYVDSFCKPGGAYGQGAVTTNARGQRVIVPTAGGCQTVDNWTYVPESGEFMTTLRFEEGALVSITSGDRVP